MNSLIRSKFLAVAALALAGLGAASVAQARSDVSFFVGLQSPVYAQPQPVYVEPQPVYVQPQPVYSQAPAYVAPAQAYAPVYRSRYEEERARRYAQWRRWQWERRHHHHDRDWDRDWGRDGGGWHDRRWD